MAGRTPAASSPRRTVPFSTPTRSPTSSSVWSPLPACRRPGSTTCATSPPRSCSRPESTSRSSPRPSGTRTPASFMTSIRLSWTTSPAMRREGRAARASGAEATHSGQGRRGRHCPPEEDDPSSEEQGVDRGTLCLSERKRGAPVSGNLTGAPACGLLVRAVLEGRGSSIRVHRSARLIPITAYPPRGGYRGFPLTPVPAAPRRYVQ